MFAEGKEMGRVGSKYNNIKLKEDLDKQEQ